MSGATFDRAALLAAMQATAANPPQPVEVPKWGTVYVRFLTVADVEAASEAAAPVADKDAPPRPKRDIARGVARILCDAEGTRVFDPSSPADIEFLASQPWALLRLITEAANAAAGGDAKNVPASDSSS